MKNLVYICKIGIIDPIKEKHLSLVAKIFSLLGIYHTASNILKNLFNSTFLQDAFQNHKVWFVAVIIIISIVMNWKKAECWAHLGNKDTIVRALLNDIMTVEKSAIVIPTNTTFDTTMENDFIREESVQGQFQKKYYGTSLDPLNSQIASDLAKDSIPYTELNDRIKTNRKRYAIGTVAKVVQNGRNYYFLAMSDVSKTGVPQNVTMETIVQALGGLWYYLANNGLREPVTIPVIGTGRAGLKDGTFEDVFKETINTFASISQSEYIAKELRICIFPQTLKNASTTWKRLCDYLRLQCDFVSEKKGNNLTNTGTPID